MTQFLRAEIVVTGCGEDHVGDLKLEALIFKSPDGKKKLGLTITEKEEKIFHYGLGQNISFYSKNDLEIYLTQKENELTRIEIKKEENDTFFYRIEKVDDLWQFTKWPEGVERVIDKGFEIDCTPHPTFNLFPQEK